MEFGLKFAISIALRYPHKYEVNESDVNYSINAVEKIRTLEPIKNIIDIVTKISADTE